METYRLTRALVPLDGSPQAEEALSYASAFAAHGVDVVLFQTISHVEPERDLLGRVEHSRSEEAVLDSARSLLDLRETWQRWKDVLPSEPKLEVAIGDPATEIVGATIRLDCNLIVATRHGRGALSRLAFGSVADELARSSLVPVLFLRPAGDENPRRAAIERVVLPFDGSELARRAFPVAAELATKLGISVHIVRAVSGAVPMAVPAIGEPFAAGLIYDDVMEQIEEDAEQSVAGAAVTVQQMGVTATHEVVDGAPAEALIERTGERDLIVMTSHGRSGFKRLLLGSVADKLVRSGHAPVVLVPAGERP